jgi:hypothetical protein
MKTLLTVLFAFSINVALACTCSAFWSFCTSTANQQNYPVIAGQIISSDSTSISVLVIEKLRGTISDTITIENYDINSCADSSMALATRLGNVGDTIIAMLHNGNNGSYFRSENSCGIGDLLITNGVCTDYIVNTTPNYPSPADYTTFSYTKIINNWKANNGDCTSLVGLVKNSLESGITFSSNLDKSVNIFSLYPANISVKVIDISGKLITEQTFRQQTTINISQFTSGIYLFQLSENGVPFMTEKLFR